MSMRLYDKPKTPEYKKIENARQEVHKITKSLEKYCDDLRSSYNKYRQPIEMSNYALKIERLGGVTLERLEAMLREEIANLYHEQFNIVSRIIKDIVHIAREETNAYSLYEKVEERLNKEIGEDFCAKVSSTFITSNETPDEKEVKKDFQKKLTEFKESVTTLKTQENAARESFRLPCQLL